MRREIEALMQEWRSSLRCAWPGWTEGGAPAQEGSVPVLRLTGMTTQTRPSCESEVNDSLVCYFSAL